MAGLPAVCKMGHRFKDQSIFLGEGSKNNSFVGCSVTCPVCGERASILDGSYSVVDGKTIRHALASTVRRLAEPGVDLDDLRSLLRILEESRSPSVAASEIKQRVQEEAPSASTALTWMKSPTGVAMATWLAVIIPMLIGLIQILIALRSQQPSVSPAQIKQMLNETVESRPLGPNQPGTAGSAKPAPSSNVRPDPPSAPSTSTASPKRQSPGAPCWCGSGSKSKHCHGRC